MAIVSYLESLASADWQVPCSKGTGRGWTVLEEFFPDPGSDLEGLQWSTGRISSGIYAGWIVNFQLSTPLLNLLRRDVHP